MNPNLIFFVFAVLFFCFTVMFLVSYIRTTKAAKAETHTEAGRISASSQSLPK